MLARRAVRLTPREQLPTFSQFRAKSFRFRSYACDANPALATDYPTRIVILSERNESKDLSGPDGPSCCRHVARHSDENPVTATPLDSALTKRDARNSFRFRSYQKCRVSPTQDSHFGTEHPTRMRVLPALSVVEGSERSELRLLHPEWFYGTKDLSPSFSITSVLFGASSKVNSFLFNGLRTLCKNTRGWGTSTGKFFKYYLKESII